MTPTFVSIDWGFFPYNGEFDTMVLADGRELPGRLLFRFGRSESGSKTLHDEAWKRLLGLFDYVGLNLSEQYAIREDRRCIEPGNFVRELHSRWPQVLDVPAWYADSNKHAGALLKEVVEERGPLRLVSFDSNHDLGYGFRGYRERSRRFSGAFGYWDADDWLLMALGTELVSEAIIVYPDWRGFNEWNAGIQNRDFISRFGNKIKPVTYSQYMQSEDADSEIVAVYLARSAGWTPPYLDYDFLRLVHSFNVKECLDCSRRGQFGVYKYDNACQVRPFPYQEWLEEEQDRTTVVNALQHAHVLYAMGQEAEAEEIISICVAAGWDVRLDTSPKYQDSFITPASTLKDRLDADRYDRERERLWWSGVGRRDTEGWNLG